MPPSDPAALAPPRPAPEGQAFRYDAFISYRHVEPDRKWAKWLHGALETYRVPRELVAKGFPKRLTRVFRDEEELPANADLSSQITAALEQSKFLIVICSPRAVESRWVNAEVEHFRRLGRHDRILALLIEGEPGKAFPPALTHIRRSLTDASGQTREEIEEVEPLAADVRPERSDVKAHTLRTHARLRLLACILGCRFDDLRQRELERRARRARGIGAGLVALILVLSALLAFAMEQRQRALKGESDAIGQRRIADQQREEAKRQQGLAESSAAEALRQKSLADENAQEAMRQQRLAEKNAAEALSQKTLADENAEEARRQQRLAEANAGEAKRQEQIANQNAARAEEQARLAQASEVQANRERDLARERAILAAASAAAEPDPTLAALLLVELPDTADHPGLIAIANQLLGVRATPSMVLAQGWPFPPVDDFVQTAGGVVALGGDSTRLRVHRDPGGMSQPFGNMMSEFPRSRLSPCGRFVGTGRTLGTLPHRIDVFSTKFDSAGVVPLIGTVETPGGCSRMAWSGDGRVLALAQDNGAILLCDVSESGVVLRTTLRPPLHENEQLALCALAVSAGGDLVGCADYADRVFVWSAATGQFSQMMYAEHGESITTMCWAKGRNLLAAGFADGVVRIWEHPAISPAMFYRPTKDRISMLRFQAEGNRLSVGSARGELVELGLGKDYSLELAYRVGSLAVRSAFEGGLNTTAVQDEVDGLSFWQIQRPKSPLRLNWSKEHPFDGGATIITAWTADPSGRLLAVAHKGKGLEIRDLATCERLDAYNWSAKSPPDVIGLRLVSGGRGVILADPDGLSIITLGELRKQRADEGKSVSAVMRVGWADSSKLRAREILFSPAGARYAILTDSGQLLAGSTAFGASAEDQNVLRAVFPAEWPGWNINAPELIDTPEDGVRSYRGMDEGGKWLEDDLFTYMNGKKQWVAWKPNQGEVPTPWSGSEGGLAWDGTSRLVAWRDKESRSVFVDSLAAPRPGATGRKAMLKGSCSTVANFAFNRRGDALMVADLGELTLLDVATSTAIWNVNRPIKARANSLIWLDEAHLAVSWNGADTEVWRRHATGMELAYTIPSTTVARARFVDTSIPGRLVIADKTNSLLLSVSWPELRRWLQERLFVALHPVMRERYLLEDRPTAAATAKRRRAALQPVAEVLRATELKVMPDPRARAMALHRVWPAVAVGDTSRHFDADEEKVLRAIIEEKNASGAPKP